MTMLKGKPFYPDCPNCGNNSYVSLSEYADGIWIGFECEGCRSVVKELYDPTSEQEGQDDGTVPSSHV